MWFGDYILPELCHLSHFFYRKGVGFYSPTPNIIEPFYFLKKYPFLSEIT